MSDDDAGVSAAGVLGSHKLRQLQDAGYVPVEKDRLERAALLGLSLAKYKAGREEEYEPRMGGGPWPSTVERIEFFEGLCDDLGLEAHSE